MAYTTVDDPTLYFQVKLYTGNGTDNHAITLDGETAMQPDFVWTKERSATEGHYLFDAARGATSVVMTSSTNVVQTIAETLKSFDSNGFTLGTSAEVNHDGVTNVAYCWKANGSGSSNTDGNTNTTKTSANTTSGFSIITYDGDGAVATLGHGIGIKPAWIIQKNLDDSENWQVQHGAKGATHYGTLNTTNTIDDLASRWNDTEPTTSLITIGTDSSVSQSGESMLMYAWAPVQGFSKFGSFIGNGNADGPFVHLGFKPAMLIIKDTGASVSWGLYDIKRNGFNNENKTLYVNSTSGEDAGGYVDLMSNGFKIISSSAWQNRSGGTFIYMAFADSPFVNSNGVPNNAR